MGLLDIKRTRAGETRQGRLRWFDEAIARFLDGNLNCHFIRGFYGAQAVGASASHNISHMRRRYSALSPSLRNDDGDAEDDAQSNMNLYFTSEIHNCLVNNWFMLLACTIEFYIITQVILAF